MNSDRGIADGGEYIKLRQTAKRIHRFQRPAECLMEDITYSCTTTAVDTMTNSEMMSCHAV